MMKQKSQPSIREAALMAFNSLPDEFRGNDLHRLVKLITRRKAMHDGSTLRKLRLLRERGEVNYQIVGGKEDSLYMKIL